MTTDFAKEMAMAAGLRNRIVHEYDDIDTERVYEALPVVVRQIPIYLATFSASLRNYRRGDESMTAHAEQIMKRGAQQASDLQYMLVRGRCA